MSAVVGISFQHEEPTSCPRTKTRDKHCHFIGRARKGNTFYAQDEDINCPLARYYLGFDKGDITDLCRTLVRWNDAINEETALKYLKSATCVSKPYKYLVYFPYPQKDISPDVIIEVGNPDEIMGIVQQFSSLTGMRINASLSGIGAACGECTAYPLIAGRENISLACYGSRPGVDLKKGELFLAFPAGSKMTEILQNGD